MAAILRTLTATALIGAGCFALSLGQPVQADTQAVQVSGMPCLSEDGFRCTGPDPRTCDSDDGRCCESPTDDARTRTSSLTLNKRSRADAGLRRDDTTAVQAVSIFGQDWFGGPGGRACDDEDGRACNAPVQPEKN